MKFDTLNEAVEKLQFSLKAKQAKSTHRFLFRTTVRPAFDEKHNESEREARACQHYFLNLLIDYAVQLHATRNDSNAWDSIFSNIQFEYRDKIEELQNYLEHLTVTFYSSEYFDICSDRVDEVVLFHQELERFLDSLEFVLSECGTT